MMPIRVLIVDDSSLMRRLLTELLSEDEELEVIGAAPDAIRAWDMIQRMHPDVLTLDVEMPRMNGLTFLEKLMRARPMAVVMVSALTEADCATTLRALELGAIDFVCKPKMDIERGMTDVRAELVRKVKSAASARVRRAVDSAKVLDRARATRPDLRAVNEVILAIGASTGGTQALRTLLAQLPTRSPGVIVVQHMPEHFTRQFAASLDKICAIRVREAADGDAIVPGEALIAPGGALHTRVERQGTGAIVRLWAGPPVNHNRPSVDVLFHSCAAELGAGAVGAILTGMGEDGAKGLLAMRNAGARTLAQDEATSIVYGMPKAAAALGAAAVVAPLDEIASELLNLAADATAPFARNGSAGSAFRTG
jgi:two-component system, chemotaxis family, protein-glutamate methylesterase/glutaminase